MFQCAVLATDLQVLLLPGRLEPRADGVGLGNGRQEDVPAMLLGYTVMTCLACPKFSWFKGHLFSQEGQA